MVDNGARPQGQGERQYLFDKPENVQRLLGGFYVCCALLLLLDFVLHRHVYHPWERLPGFYAIYGFIGCVVLVLVAKWMRTFLMRPADYYDSAAKQAAVSVSDDQGDLND